MMFNILRRYFSWRLSVVIITWILGLALIGMVDFVDFTFAPHRIVTATFIIDSLTLIFVGILIFSTSLMVRHVKLKEEDEATQQKDAEIPTLLKKKTKLLPEFVIYKNTNTRKKIYIKKLENQKQKILSKMTEKCPEHLEIWNSGTKKQKKNSKWCRKLQTIDLKLDEKFIEQNKSALPAKFRKITPNFILRGTNDKAYNKHEEQTPSEPVKQAVKDNWFSFIMPMLFTILILSTIITHTDEPLLGMIFQIAIKVTVLFMQKVSADYYAEPFTLKTWVADVDLRYQLSCEYLKWIPQEKGSVTDA